MNIHIICVGKLKEKFYTEAVAEYAKRLGAYCRLTITELPEERLPQNPSQGEIDAALEREAGASDLSLSSDGRTVLCFYEQGWTDGNCIFNRALVLARVPLDRLH